MTFICGNLTKHVVKGKNSKTESFLSIINADSCKSWSQVGDGAEIWKQQQKEVEELRKLRKTQKGSQERERWELIPKLQRGGQRECVNNAKLT